MSKLTKLDRALLYLFSVVMAPFTLIRGVLFVIEHVVQLIGLIVATPVLLLCVLFCSEVNWSDVANLYQRVWDHFADTDVFYM